MISHSVFDDAEPPPSYEEAVIGSSGNNQRPPPPPPPTPPRSPTTNNHSDQNSHIKPHGTQPIPTTPGGPASSSSLSTTPQTPAAQTFQQILPTPPRVNRQFPPAFNLYRDALAARPSSFSLGEHQSSPIYAVTAWSGWSAQASLVLHNGPTEDYPPLASVTYGSPARRMDVFLPPLPGRPPAPASVQVPGAMRARFAFSVEVPLPGAGAGVYRAESFEWRRSNSPAVGSLGGRSQGWKLVRLSNELPPGAGGRGPPSGDGHEVVAVCAHAVMSMSKLWKFAFTGTGASGALGERWAVMAVITGLVIWDQESRGS